jgi:hypothetical protein
MIDLKAETIAELVDESERLLRPHFEKMDELEHWLVSRGYGSGDEFEGGEDWPENVPHSFVSLLLPRMTHAAPRFIYKGGGSKRMREQTLGLQTAQNMAARQTRMHHTLAPAAVNYLLGFTCIYVDCEAQPSHRLTPAQRRMMQGSARHIPKGAEQRKGPQRTGREYKKPAGQPRYYDAAMPSWPMADHLVRHSFGWDMRARTWDKVRFFWHDVVEDLEDLLARAAADPEHWDEDAIKRLGTVRAGDNPYNPAPSNEAGDTVQQVRYRMVFVPEGRITEDEFDPESGQPRKVTKQPGDHEHGVWLTIGVPDGSNTDYARGRRFGEASKGMGVPPSSRGEFLAKPFYRRGSRNPPYKIFGAFVSASKTIPYSSLTATHEQIRLWNDLSAAVNRRMKRYSRQVLYDLKDESTVEAILEAADDDFVGIPGFETGKAQVIERGGASQQDIAHMQMQQQNVYRGVGLSETLQGNSTNNTATAEGYAAQSGLSRIAHVVAGWEHGLASVAEEQSWHMAYSDDFWIVLDEAAKIETAMADMQPFIEAGMIDAQSAEQLARIAAQKEIAIWQGGDFAEDPSLDFGLVQVEIEPWSMERRDLAEQRQDVMTLVPLVAQIGQLVIQQPHIEWREILRMVGQVFRQPDLEKFLRMDIAQQMSQMMLAQGLQDVQLGGSLSPGVQRQGGPGGGPAGGRSGMMTAKPQRPAAAAKPMAGAQGAAPAASPATVMR